jgi:Tfp pilus assembly protein PilO
MRERTPDENLKMLGWMLHGAGLGMTLLSLAAVVLALFLPIGHELRRCKAGLAELDSQMAESLKVRREHQQVKDELVRLRTQKSLLRQRITDGASEDEFLRQVSAAAETSRLQLREYRPGDAQRDGEYGSMTIHLDGEGTHASICKFLDELARLPRLCKVQRVQVSSSNQSMTYPVSLAVEIFFAAHPQISSSPEKPHGQRAG